LHARGLRLGVYLSAGRETCAGRPGSAGHLESDVTDLARWGVDYLKVDWCHARGLRPPAIYAELRDAVREAGRPMVLSISTWGAANPWQWGPSTGHLWRIDHDLPYVARGDMWRSVVTVAAAEARLGAYSRPGAWNDPDVLPLGWGGLTPTEERTTFSLWSVMAAPLLAGADVRRLSARTREAYVNSEVIAVDQDPVGIPGSRVASTNGLDVWVRPLADGSRALLLVNRNAHAARFRLDAAGVAGPGPGRVRMRDLWTHRTAVGSGTIDRRVAPHGVAMLRVSRG
jgi:alpha-galactosidase